LRSSPSDANGGGADAGPYRHTVDRARGRLGRLASTVFYYPTIGSTNDAAAFLAASRSCVGPHPERVSGPWDDRTVARPDAEGLVVVADEQTAGRGRRGHTWFSPPGSGLYVSVVVTPARAAFDPPRAIRLLTLAAGVALVEAIDRVTGLAVDLKWPNDLHAGGRKVGGILAEGLSVGSTIEPVVVGYGLNVRAAAYPPELEDRATSLEAELGCAVERDRLFIETLAALARRYDDLLAGRFDAILDAWRRHAPFACGARVRWGEASREQSGITAGIDDHGALLVRTGECTERIVAGELRWEI
jgi:BirA family biotin operon repressor/biotin-[acetyl-CoA-carboxylase] ligase